MIKQLFWFLVLFCIIACKTPTGKTTVSDKNNFDLKTLTILDPKLTETSGLEIIDDLVITHNDSGDLPTLYFLNQKGQLHYSKTYKNMKAVDWEDITKDDTHIYIADLGNNYGNRKDLTIYKIAINDLNDENALVEKLQISYPDQTSFKKGNQDHPYDAESIVAIKDELFVFSKDWKKQTTVIYKIDKNEPIQKAQKISSYNVKGLITGATFNGNDKVLLSGYNSSLEAFVYEVDYDDRTFTFIKKTDLQIKGGAQVEGITFLKSNNQKETYLISSETTQIKLGEDEALSPSQLYQLTIATQNR
ncbi:hypothetical protein LX97_00724 [Nonlabens dokdonensis]|jgi:hypothetical protein|uniref:Uncharacterized protein n=2 Tax=Nonlabens dokdonensis TaxID=328515 RepID=L7W3D8_NONDD|nr:hypothetical protein [Nonlabens dokdonensis]AGC76050.1 hypothetical protein DDD_0923 [Nonlabens dokdonensis DSW-6]PZX43722.1 hypothetical protein LX97_00724 [Nonlabens dokdonensis]